MTRWKTAKGLWMQLRLPKLHLALTEQDFKSPATFSYNCVGFAIGDPRWWQPSGDEVHVWPVDLPRGDYQHENLQELEGKQYGAITAYMKRSGYIDFHS